MLLGSDEGLIFLFLWANKNLYKAYIYKLSQTKKFYNFYAHKKNPLTLKSRILFLIIHILI